MLDQFHLLHERFPASKSRTKGLLMSAYLKLMLLDQGNEQLQKEVRYLCWVMAQEALQQLCNLSSCSNSPKQQLAS